MNSHSDKSQENRSQANANSSSRQRHINNSTFQFVDNRPEAIAQRKLQEMANNSPQVKQLQAIQTMADNSPQAGKATQLQAMANNYPAKPIQKNEIEEEELLQGKFATVQRVEEEEELQLKAASVQKKENNTGLPDNLKSGIENLSGYSMEDVKVHYNSGKPAQLQAHAFAQGTDIHLGPGQEKHLPHETWHVVQQKQGGRVKPTMLMMGGVSINDDKSLEHEAEVMGTKATTVSKAIGAQAYTTGSKIAFSSSSPDLQTTAHEAGQSAEGLINHWAGIQNTSPLQRLGTEPNGRHGFAQVNNSFLATQAVQLNGDPIEETVLDKDTESVKSDINQAMLKIKAKIIAYTESSQDAKKKLSAMGRDSMIYAPFTGWYKGMLGLLKGWDDSWGIEDTVGLLLDMGIILKRLAIKAGKTGEIMNEEMGKTRQKDKKIDKNSEWAINLPGGTATQAGVSATTGGLLKALRFLNVNTPLEIEAIMNGVILYWKNSKIKQMMGEFHTSAEVWASYTFHLENYIRETEGNPKWKSK